MNNQICCVIVTYNCGHEFITGFDKISSQVNKIVIVDNGSGSKTIKMLKNLKEQKNIELILNDQNMGIAKALNQGVEYAIANNYDWIITMDHDSKPDDNMVKYMMDAYRSFTEDEQDKIVSILPSFLEEKLLNNEKNDHSENKNEVLYISGGITSGNLVKTSIFKEIGFFNEELFIDYVDYDICFRMIEKDYKIIQVQNAILIHNLGDTNKKSILGKSVRYSNHSFVRRYYITRNRMYVWEKYKDVVPDFVSKDKNDNLKEIVKILLFENNKVKKIQMVIKGIKDFRNNTLGRIN